MTVIHILYVNVGQPKETDDTSKPSEYFGRMGTRGMMGVMLRILGMVQSGMLT